MPLDIEATDIYGRKATILINKYPDACPICHRAATPRLRNAFRPSELASERRVELYFSCPADTCQRTFIAIYAGEPQFANSYYFARCAPVEMQRIDFSEQVQSVSSNFVAIYNQAHYAEQLGLEQICGVGYRKALEFLVKDYCANLHPDKAETIKKQLLAPCIEQYVTDSNAKACAKRAAWLGNDETHYLRVWEDHDIDDLKTLIRITCVWIESALLTKEFQTKMPDKQKK